MINLTREEAQQLLDALKNSRATGRLDDQAWGLATQAIETLRAKLSEPKPEPVAWLNKTKHGTWSADVLKCEGDEPSEPLYTAPPQREWVGLTDEERTYLAWESNNGRDCVAMTEAKLKEKNG